MVTERRTLLKGLAASLLVPWTRIAAQANDAEPLFAAAYRDRDGGYGAASFDEAGARLSQVSLPSRGHGLAVDPARRRVIAFARRPGDFAVCWSNDNAFEPVWFSPPKGRHFYGHGIVSADGQLLYTSENDFETGRGVIGIYDATKNFAPVGAFSTGGIGPHDLALMPDGKTLVVANGGILTHPDHGREMLNLDTMAPSLAYLDCRNGDVINQVKLAPDLHKLSIRHLAVNDHGQVVIGCQHNGGRNEQPDLVFTHRPGEVLQSLLLPEAATQSLRNYVSSVALDSSGRYAAITSSRGSAALVIDIEKRTVVRKHILGDVSGAAPSSKAPGTFLVTTGDNTLVLLGSEEQGTAIRTPGLSWDNHVVRAV